MEFFRSLEQQQDYRPVNGASLAEPRQQSQGIKALAEQASPGYWEVLDRRTALTEAAVVMGKLYEQIGVPQEDRMTLYTAQTVGTEDEPLRVEQSVLHTLSAADVASEVTLGIEDGVRIAEERRAAGRLVHSNDIFTAPQTKL
jgi:hypothetical protein